MKCLNDFHLQNQRFMSISMADGFRCISLAKSRMRESRMSGSVRGCSLRGQSTRPAMPDKDTILTEQNRTEQNRTAWANCALFASCDSETFQTAYYIRDG